MRKEVTFKAETNELDLLTMEMKFFGYSPTGKQEDDSSIRHFKINIDIKTNDNTEKLFERYLKSKEEIANIKEKQSKNEKQIRYVSILSTSSFLVTIVLLILATVFLILGDRSILASSFVTTSYVLYGFGAVLFLVGVFSVLIFLPILNGKDRNEGFKNEIKEAERSKKEIVIRAKSLYHELNK